MPDVDAAHGVWDGAWALRHEVEARLLAAQDDDAIAARCGITPGAVAAYARLFYDVRPRLHARSYILHNVVGAVVDLGRPPPPRPTVEVVRLRGGPARPRRRPRRERPVGGGAGATRPVSPA